MCCVNNRIADIKGELFYIMGEELSRREISSIYEKYKVEISRENTTNKELLDIIKNLNIEHISFERPDAYMCKGNFVYGIEHFQFSQYEHHKGDVGKIADSSKNNREKLKKDRKFDLKPSTANLYSSFENALSSHMSNVKEYKNNVFNKIGLKSEENKYRFIVLVEDTSDSASYIQKFDTKPVCPILIDKFAKLILGFQDDLWAVIYIGGDTKIKTVEGYTLDELKELKDSGKLYDYKKYRTMHSDDVRMVSKDDAEDDEHILTLTLYDGFFLRD